MATETPTMDQHALAQGRTFTWHELYVPDIQKAIDFYTQALGFGTQEMPMGESGTYQMLTNNGQGVCGIMGTNNPEMSGVPPHWSTYVAVDDLDARLAKCLELGAKVLFGPLDVPKVGRMVHIQDPQGATLWLFKSSEG
jgi:predicted enzyme related to lactoylglutathione lyase